MTQLNLNPGTPSAWISITPGQAVTLQVTATTGPLSVLIEGQIDGATVSPVATTSNLMVGNEYTFDAKGHNQVRVTATSATATVNVSPFGGAGLAASPLSNASTPNKRFALGAPRVVFAGDSITAGGAGQLGGSDPTDPSKPQTYSTGYNQWATVGMMLLQGRALFAGIAAKAGSTVVQVAGQGWTNDFINNACKVNPDAIVMLDGANDLLQWPTSGSPTGTPTTSQWQAFVIQKTANIRLCLSKNVIPIICSVLPRNVVGSLAAAHVPVLNTFLRTLAAEFNVPFVDLYSVMVNPDGSQKAGYFSADGTHPTPLGVWAMAQQFSATLSGLLGTSANPMTSWNPADAVGAVASLTPQFGAAFNTSALLTAPGNYNAFNGSSSFYTAGYGMDDTGHRTFKMSSVQGGHNDEWGLQLATGFAPGDLVEYAWRFRYVNPDPNFLLNLNAFYGPNTDTDQIYPGFAFDTKGAWLYARVEQKIPKATNGWAVDAPWVRPIVHLDTSAGSGIPSGLTVEMGPISMLNLTRLGLAAW